MPHQCLSCGETFADGSTDLLQGCPGCEGTRFFYTEEPLDGDEREELKEKTDDDVEQMLQELVQGDERPDLGEDIWSREAWEAWIRTKSSDEEELPEKAKAALENDGDVKFEHASEPSTESAPDQADEGGPTLEPEDDPDLEIVGEQDTDLAADPEPDVDDEEPKDPIQVELGDVEETSPPGQSEQASELEDEATDLDAVPEEIGPEGRPSTLNISGPGEYEIDVERLMEDSPVIVERDGSYMIHLPSVFKKEKD